MGETLLSEAIEHVDVLAELALFREHSLHEWAVGAVGFEPPQQQLGVGAQCSQWIAQLMHEGAQLLVLLAEFLAKLQAFQVTPRAWLMAAALRRIRWSRVSVQLRCGSRSARRAPRIRPASWRGYQRRLSCGRRRFGSVSAGGSDRSLADHCRISNKGGPC